MDYQLLYAVIAGVVLLLFLILKLKIQAFIALLIASIFVGVLAGMPPSEIIKTMQMGMGNTLGFVAIVIGLGAIFGAILEHSGGAEVLASYLLNKFGEKNASWALMLTGFLIAIPVFFDVAFIILVPLIYSLQRKTNKSLLLYGIPLLAGLAITHTFIPPTPGPIAVADIIAAELGWVILFGFIVGGVTAIFAGPIFGKYIGNKIFVKAPKISATSHQIENYPAVGLIFSIIGLPIVLIVLNTVLNSDFNLVASVPEKLKNWLALVGHPFSALIIANLITWYLLGLKRGVSKTTLLQISTDSLKPAGIIILLTGAGGVFKQVLVNTGTGEMLAQQFASNEIGIFFFAYASACIIRILQGSATVAMITAAGITAPLIGTSYNEIDKALLVIAIASGASILSHVNDSGFWLVSKYLNLNEKQTFKSWTVLTTIISVVGFTTVFILSYFV